MNLVLVDPSELAADATCSVRDRRALHLRTVLGATVGSRVRAGLVGGATGSAELLADDGDAITLRLSLTEPASTPLPVDLVLAIPRPKVLTRVIEAAAAFGVARIDLTNAWRVDKSYLRSPRLEPESLALAARLGAEQGATTHLPPIATHRRLMALLDARWPGPPGQALPPGTRLLAHPGAPPIETAFPGVSPVEAALSAASPFETALSAASPLETALSAASPLVLAIGPEGGWIEREVETFVARGFTPVSLGAPILRVETAVAAALGQLLMLRRLAGG